MTMTSTVKLLVGLAPRTCCATDDGGQTPLDYVRLLFVLGDEYQPYVDSVKEELEIATELCMTTSVLRADRRGTVVSFSSESSDDDDVSVLSM